MSPASTRVPSLLELRADAASKEQAFEMHFDRCPTQRGGSQCKKCDDLVIDLVKAEAIVREATATGNALDAEEARG